MNHAERTRRIRQADAGITRLLSLRALHETRALFIPKGVSSPDLYRDGQREIIAGIDAQTASLQAERDELTAQTELLFG